METFATVEQYDARYPDRSCSDGLLGECLEDATAAIMAALDARGVDYDDPPDDYADRLMRVCRSVANRLVPADGGIDIPQDVTNTSITAGPYSQSYTLGASYGTAKLLPSELRLLGIGGSRAGWAPLGGRDD